MILAAHDIIREAGIQSVTLAAVVKRSGVAKTTFYRHFRSISELVVCSADAHVVEPPVPNTGSLRRDILELCFALLPIYSLPENRRLITSLIHASASDPALQELHDRTIENRKKPLEIFVRNAIRRGELPPDTNIELAARFIEAPFIEQILVCTNTLTDDHIELLVDWVCRGLNVDESKTVETPL